MSTPRLLIKHILEEKRQDQVATVKGWVRTVRKSKKFSFIVVNDGSTMEHLQIIVDNTLSNYEEIHSMLIGTAVAVTGLLVESGGKGQQIEMQAKRVEIIGASSKEYPLQKKATSLEFLRENAHLRVRTDTFSAVFRIRHVLTLATHNFFNERGFIHLASPIITGIDAEGAGEMFKVSSLDLENLPRNEKGEIDYSQDYFGRDTSLCVTGQLEAECFALGLGATYTFGPTFRSENSNTPRHLAEFWMVEPEVAFFHLEDVAHLATDYIKYLIKDALEKCPKELEFLAKRRGSTAHIDTIEHVLKSDFITITYTEAIDILQKTNQSFDFSPQWGEALQTEHERFLAEKHYGLPVIVTDYPKECKAFYMHLNDDNKTVKAMDVLVPGVGELIGGSERESRLDILEQRMNEFSINKEDYWWYLDLRRFGSVPHSGFGLGFERAVMYITGMDNIRDVIPFPRTPKHADF